ncbi:MAG: esterase-like activity of phytase family protein [Planctomycetes bacterium]|nr:esterase-like activity of phytase family protein [Planctomycetota bacterium]
MPLRSTALGALFLGALTAPLAAQQGVGPDYFRPVATYGVQGGIAEIVTASPDGRTLAFSDADSGRIGFVDITNPSQPLQLPDVITGGEPTSVSWVGRYVLAAVIRRPPQTGQAAPDPADPLNAGGLFVIDASNPQAAVVVATIPLGFQPDSVKAVRRGDFIVAVVCIENQPIVVDANGNVLGEDRPGFPTSGTTFPQDRSLPGAIQVVTIDAAQPIRNNVATVALPEVVLSRAGCLYAADPQPEFVDIHGTRAAVSLQENNGLAIVDFFNPLLPVLVRVFSTGNASERIADLRDNRTILFADGYPSAVGGAIPAAADGAGNRITGGPRMTDGVAFSPDGSVIYCADEGELNYTGGRGWSGFSVAGLQVFEDGGLLERIAELFGQYPDGRSDARGIEVEGVAAARFGNRDFAFVLSERGSFMGIYDISNPSAPFFVQFLPTGISPEGVVAIPSRDLVVTADEVSGTLSIYEGMRGLPFDPSRPLPYSLDGPFGALSGLDDAPGGAFAVPDNALPTAIYYIGLQTPLARVMPLIPVLRNGVQARYDGEGIAVDRSILALTRPFGGFWIASEGNGTTQPNLLIQTDLAGNVLREIQLPNSIDAGADPAIGGNAVGSAGGGRIRGNGFEGLSISADGRYLLAAVQRSFNGEAATHTRIARYDLQQIAAGTAPSNGLRFGGDWQFFYYPLEAETGAGFVGLSEITTIGPGQYLVIERDQGVGTDTALKAIYAFSMAGLVPDTDGVPGEASGSDTVTKVLAVDVQSSFFPYEKVEGVAIRNGRLWVCLDNDGGALENRIVDLGRFVNPLGN